MTQVLLTKHEAAVLLRLCDDDATPSEAESAVRAVGTLIATGRLRAIRIGRHDRIAAVELDAFIARELAAAGGAT